MSSLKTLPKNKVRTVEDKGSDLTKNLSYVCSGLICVYLLFALSLFSSSSDAETAAVQEPESLLLKVLSSEGTVLPSVVVELESDNKAKQQSQSKMAIMDQVDQQFVPHVLVVQQGQAVSFPNSDEVKHHVYSFSPTKTFQQQLYKGREAKPILFGTPGIIELGCNIHDWMQGFIYVAQSQQYALSDKQGLVSIKTHKLPKQIHIWHPLMKEQTKRITVALTDLEKTDGVYQIQLKEELNESLTDYERFSIDVY